MTYYEIMKKIIGYPVRLGPHPPPRIKKIIIAAVVGIMIGVLASAQQQTNITTTVCPGVGCVDVTTSGQGTLAITISGTWVGTITFSGTVDGTNYTSLGMALITTPGTIVTTTTGNGTWSGSVAGLQKVRIAFTAFTSGTAAISARTQQSANHIGGGSGGGGSGTVTSITVSAPLTGGTITTTGTIGCATCATATSSTAFTNKTGAISQWTNDSAYLTAITGGTCTNQAVTVISTAGVPSCTTLTSAYVNNTIALTGTDINTSNQVTVTHLAAALPVAQGGTGVAASTGTVAVVLSTSPTLITPILGTPTSVTLTNATGLPESGLSLTDITTANASATAHGFLPKWPNNTTTWLRGDGTYTAVTAGTNANLTGVITSVGNATSIGAQTGTGTTFVTSVAPTITGPTTLTEVVGSSDLTLTGATQTTSQPALNITQTWNNAGVAFTAIKLNVTKTADNNSSLLLDLQQGGASKFSVGEFGNVTFINDVAFSGRFFTNGTIGNGFGIGATGLFFGTGSGQNTDLAIVRASATQLDIGLGANCSTVANCRDLRVRHYIGGGTAPAVTNTSANSCGTTAATLAGSDTAGKVTVGATSGTSCTVTFAVVYANAPACSATDESTAVLTTAKSTTTTVILSGVFTAADVVAYHCFGY